MNKKSHHIPRVLFSKGLFLALIVLLLFVSVSMLREVKHKQQIQKDVLALQQELVDTDSNNSRLENFIEYLKTDEYAELEAKKRLGMKKEGEDVLLITREEVLGADETSAESATAGSNWKKWWSYFFK